MIEALYVPAILLALAISGAVIVAAELLRALDLTASVDSHPLTDGDENLEEIVARFTRETSGKNSGARASEPCEVPITSMRSFFSLWAIRT